MLLCTQMMVYSFLKNSVDVTFCRNEMGFLVGNLNNFNLDNNLDEDDSDTIIFITLLAWQSKFRKRKALEKYE